MKKVKERKKKQNRKGEAEEAIPQSISIESQNKKIWGKPPPPAPFTLYPPPPPPFILYHTPPTLFYTKSSYTLLH